jgi:hypothetical protein
MPTGSPSALPVFLAEAVEAYGRGWRTVDEELYTLCRRRSRPTDFADVYAKVAMIGRVYSAGVTRSWKAGGDAEMGVARVLVSAELAASLNDGLQRLGGRPFDRQTAAEIVELHGHVTRAISEHSGGVFLTSFVSKYLHFHCPTVPIYDSNAQAAIKKFVDRTKVDAIRKELRALHGSVWAYRNFVAAFLTLCERIHRESESSPTVKEIDCMLWQSLEP